MKARLATVLATAVVALALATGALAASHHSDYMGPAASTGWASYDAFAVKPNPWGSRGSYRPNPTGARGSVHGW